jgi:Amt family ammonium transporter
MNDELASLSVIFTEFYYWVTVVFMFLIHVGLCLYEVGASRRKHHLATLIMKTMVPPLVTVTFFFFGWWIYFALPNGPGITGGVIDAPWATGWSELMAPHMGGPAVQSALTADDAATWARLNGVFWAAFLLFSWTVASIVSGALIERIRPSAFFILAVLIGSIFWVIDAAWGWHPDGWMVQLLGYHDAYASGVIHAIAGGFALGILIVLGSRIGKFRPDGTPRNINPHNPWLVAVGFFVIYTGFWGFYVACNIPIFDVQPGGATFFTATNIYLAPTTLSGITLNFLMSLSGGMLAGYIMSKGDSFWIYSGGLAGVIATSAGNDLYHPIQAMLIGAICFIIVYKLHFWVERRFKLDDACGVVAVHGYAGFLGVVIAGFMLWGYPSSPNPQYAHINPFGNFIGAIIMFVLLGFVPGFIAAKTLNAFGALRIPREVELAGLDMTQIAERHEDSRELLEAITREEDVTHAQPSANRL